MTERTRDTDVERDANHVRDRYGEQAKLYAETRAEAAATAGVHDDVVHWETVAEKLNEDDGE